MQLATARACFEALAARGTEPDLCGVSGVWELDLTDAPEKERTWSIRVDDGRLAVTHAAAPGGPDARIHLRESDLVRLASGQDRENVITSVLRGAVTVEGDLRFAQRIQAILPIRTERKSP